MILNYVERKLLCVTPVLAYATANVTLDLQEYHQN